MTDDRSGDPIALSSDRPPGLRYLVIVARDRPELFGQLTRQFAADPTAHVVIDRRIDDRRRSDRTGEDEANELPGARDDRRVADRRRATFQVVAKLWLAGYVIIRVD